VARSRWRLADLRGALDWLAGYSLPGVCRAPKRLKVGRRRGHFRWQRPAPAYAQKLATIAVALGRARRPAPRVAVLYADEFSLYRQPTLGPAYGPRGTAPAARRSLRANRYYRYAGALDAATGRVTWLGRSTLGVANLRRFLVKLRRAHGDRPLCLIWGNWPVHQHPALADAAADLDTRLLYVPTYAPWTNPIEKLWRWLTEDLLRHHTRADACAQLRAEVAAWLDQFAHGSDAPLRYCGLAP
jgi:transposase